MSLLEVQFDFEVTGKTFRKPTNLETILNKKYFYGKLGLNVQLDRDIFISKEESDQLAEDIHRLSIRQELGENITDLEKFALKTLMESYGN